MRLFKKILFCVFGFALCVLLIEGAYFIWVYFLPPVPPVKVDCVLLYSGHEDRSGRDLEWAKKDKNVVFFYSGWDYRRSNLEKELGIAPSRILMESRARTTDQNARFCAPILREKGVRFVVLALPWYHLPRALFLTRLYLLGSGVTVTPYATLAPPEHWWKSRETYVEPLKLWGSLGRIVLSWFGFEEPLFHVY